MSSTTWTPRAVASRAKPVGLALWRAVEAQHAVSTMRLTDGVAEQRVLEGILEESKPLVPPEARELHYLLSTPFRYPSPHGSRFRTPGDPGVLYGAEEPRTACAELGYWRWHFFTENTNLSQLGRLGPVPHTLFRAGIDTNGVDLRERPFVRAAARWTDPGNYAGTQAFAETARAAGLGAIRYQSVRDPEAGACVAALRPEAFKPKRPTIERTWFLTVTPHAVTWQRDGSDFEFSTDLPTWTVWP